MRYVPVPHRALPALLLALTLASCGDATIDSGALLEPQLARATGVANLPFGGRCETVISELETTATGQTMHLTGVCQLRAIGRVYWDAQQTVTFSGEMQNTGTYTTPSGDQLYASFTGNGAFAFPIVTFSGTETYRGGTGRFADAVGAAQAEGSARIDLLVGSFETSGSIAF